MKPETIRNVLRWSAIAFVVAAVLALTGLILNRHIEVELERARDQAAINYVKTGKFPLGSEEVKPERAEQPFGASSRDPFLEGLEEGERQEVMHSEVEALMRAAQHAGVSLPPNIDEDAAADECASMVDTAPAVWQRDHQTQILLQDLFVWSAGSLARALQGIAGWFGRVALYLSLPFRIALGVGFGVAFGAWLIKKTGLSLK